MAALKEIDEDWIVCPHCRHMIRYSMARLFMAIARLKDLALEEGREALNKVT